jgi:high-affinity nickel-transport protein
MMFASAFTVFALGLRHGADPDHLAAIDNVTRNSYRRMPLLSRFAGTLFALGHSVMVFAIAALVGALGVRFAAHSAAIESAGTWVSIVVLFALAALNVRQLWAGSARVQGLRSRLLPRVLRDGTSALLALPIGLLFGFGFETSSQVATYTLAFSLRAGVAGAVLVGAAFCVGMMCTDTLDSLLVHRLVSSRQAQLPRAVRTWLWSVTILAIVVALYELAQQCGWTPPLDDLEVSGLLVASLICVFARVFILTRRARAIPQSIGEAPS